MTVPSMCLRHKEESKTRDDKRQVFVAATIGVYAFEAVSPWVYAAIVAAFGAGVVISHSVTKTCMDLIIMFLTV